MARLDNATSSNDIKGAARSIDVFLSPIYYGFSQEVVARGGAPSNDVKFSAKIGAGATGSAQLSGQWGNTTAESALHCLQLSMPLQHVARSGSPGWRLPEQWQVISIRAQLAWASAVALSSDASCGMWFGGFDGALANTSRPRDNSGYHAFGLSMNSSGQIAFIAKKYDPGLTITETAITWPAAVTEWVSAEIRVFNGSDTSPYRVQVFGNGSRLLDVTAPSAGLASSWTALPATFAGYTACVGNWRNGILPANPLLYWRDFRIITGPNAAGVL